MINLLRSRVLEMNPKTNQMNKPPLASPQKSDKGLPKRNEGPQKPLDMTIVDLKRKNLETNPKNLQNFGHMAQRKP